MNNQNITVRTHQTFTAFVDEMLNQEVGEIKITKSLFPWSSRNPSSRPMTDAEIRQYENEGVDLHSALDIYEQEAKDELMGQGRIKEAEAFEVVRTAKEADPF